ncbi:MAG: hypothetical protein MUE42_00425 [Opitutaceae bacterium]|nr:hypothetical protein [Opitutaceae bacterium]
MSTGREEKAAGPFGVRWRVSPAELRATLRGAYETWKWSLAAGATVLWVISIAVVYPAVWVGLGVWNLEPLFVDLAAVFAAGEAWMIGRDVYLVNPFDPFGRPHVYGPWWLVSGPMALSVDDARWVGPLVVAGFLTVTLAVARPRGPGAAAMVAGLLLTAPFVLGMERANNDLIVVILLAVAAWGIGRGGWWARAGGGVIVVAGGLKIYPVVALTALGATKRRPCWWALAGWVVACGLVAWVWREEFRRALEIAPRPRTIFSYGLGNLGLLWRGYSEYWWLIVGPGLVAGVAACRGLWRVREGLWELIPLTGGRAAAHVAGAACWVFCYAANSNFPYRATLLGLCLGLWLRRADEAGEAERRAGRRLCAVVLIASVLAAPKMWLAYAVEQGADKQLPTLGAVAVSGADQTLWLVITLALAVTLAGWTVRWLAARRREA